MKTKKTAFTLIEMLIVVVIIGILAAAIIPRLQGAQERARDIRRQADIRTISSALMIYYADNQTFPTGQCNSQWLCNGGRGGAQYTEQSSESGFLTELQGQYLNTVPVDPLNPERDYMYAFSPNSNNADSNWIRTTCSPEHSNWKHVATISYSPEVRRETDIVRSCPDGTPWDYKNNTSFTNRYYFDGKWNRSMWIFDDRYSPLGEKKVSGECFDKNKSNQCTTP